MRKLRILTLLCAFLLCLATLSVFAGCGKETVTIYPCYFNRDVEGMDGTAIRAALEQAGWILQQSEQDGAYDNATTYIYRCTEGESKKCIVIYEFATAEQAEAAYEADGICTYFPSSIFPAEYSVCANDLRISNCCIMTLRNSHVDLMEILGLGAVEALEVPTENTQELRRNIKSVDIEAVRTEMEADGYAFYQIDFFAQEEGEDFVPTYLIVSPAQNRVYVYTQALKPKFGMSYTYFVYQIFERVAMDVDGEDINVGMHFVGFMDGGCVMCYKGTFGEIEQYFAE